MLMENFDVLFVDDEPALLDSFRLVFDLEGIKAFCVESGEEALDAIREKRFKVIFTDMKMNGINGIEFARTAKESIPETPIYLLTGNSPSPELTSQASEAGITRILSKPISMDSILDIVKNK